MFSIEGKVVLITGGASGIGLFTTREFLKAKVRGVTIADMFGERVVENLGDEFGANRVVFIKTDVTKITEIEDAFNKTIQIFGNIDILVNSAGICRDNEPEKEIAINLTGTLHANFFALDKYIRNYKSGYEGVIVNISSVSGLDGGEALPVYTATNHAVVGLGRSLGTENHYRSTNVRVLTICPAATKDLKTIFVGPRYKTLYSRMYVGFRFQKPEVVGKSIMRIIQEGSNGSIWTIIEGETQEVKLPSLGDLLHTN